MYKTTKANISSRKIGRFITNKPYLIFGPPVASSSPEDRYIYLPAMIVLEQDRSFIISVVEKMNRNPQTDYSIDSLALDAGMSIRKFTDIFRSVTGNSVHQQLTVTRMEKAMELLRSSNLPVSNISKKVGYRSSSSFTRKFKKYADMTPLEYRHSQ
ncbi:helix-turn-helix transcriptional regulator [Chitinophaga sp. NPDC101104]|uniref:helix-turn-helix transcriptional regulator n=1 Tax=Chitinophaga sp. NPDC101104 TaxID=3390561 RepID=UPI003D051491